MKRYSGFIIIPLLLVLISSCKNHGFISGKQPEIRSVYIDSARIVRWTDNNQEVALFGANYSLPSACDFRAANMVTSDLKKVVDQDMEHFARMGWDGMRLCLWGDWENTDKKGNLVKNDHLDLLDYIISKARERAIYILLTPISTYSSLWPDAMSDTASVDGISKYYNKSELGINPDAIAAQINYIRQLLQHVNPYTGMALKDDPIIIFIETINEPWHHPEDPDGSIKYINALTEAVKGTGCNKLLFYNVSQDMKMASLITKTKVDGVTFAWYPAGLVSGKIIEANLLRTVDDYTPMHTTELAKMAKIVYEFDEADSHTPYMYPAMARDFRSVGAQFVSMFSYDMIATAPYNLGWQTHLMNMVYYPQKTIGAMIACQVMKTLPRMQNYGTYPDNTVFGPFRISYEDNLSEMVTIEKFMYANNTKTIPPNCDSLKQIVGYGSSPLIGYEGQGLYFLDKIKTGLWRLEIYPDAKIVSDPFAQPSKNKIVSRLIFRDWHMSVKLSDLGASFYVSPLNKNNLYSCQATRNGFRIKPGVYLLSVSQEINKNTLPEKIGEVGLEEFNCPDAMTLPVDLNSNPQDEYIAGRPIKITAEVIDTGRAEDVAIYIRDAKYHLDFEKFPMVYVSGYTYTATLPQSWSSPGIYEYCIEVSKNNYTTVFPSRSHKSPSSWDFYEKNFWRFIVVNETTTLRLLYPERDVEDLAFTRIGDGVRWGIFNIVASDQDGSPVIRLFFPQSMDNMLEDYTMSLIVKNRIKSRGYTIKDAASVFIKARSVKESSDAFIRLMEADGTTWSKKISLTDTWEDYVIPIKQFRVSKGVMLPQGFPERWNYWVEPAKGRGHAGDFLQMDKVERLQISLMQDGIVIKSLADKSIEISEVLVLFNR